MKDSNLKEHSSMLKVKDHFVSGEIFELLYDEKRDMLLTHPQPETSKLGAYYESEDYISHSDKKRGLLGFLYDIVKKRAIKKKLGLIESFSKNPKILDLGCGTGEFLLTAKNKGWNTQGVETSDKARDLAIGKGLDVKKDLSKIDQKFDVITLWHVLEHLPDLDQLSEKFSRLLNPNGILIIAVPNFRSFDARFYKEYWAAYDVPRHLWHFSRKSIQVLFQENFDIIKIKPMIFDSFYVSLLSEKYKTGKAFSLRAFFIGLWSNIVALRTKEQSSLIYCLKSKK